MTEYSMGWDESSGRWRIWAVTRTLVADRLTLTQGAKLLGELRARSVLDAVERDQ